ncbi:MAG: hypothetical protein ABIQ40_12925 [Bacteroidia bacterium]
MTGSVAVAIDLPKPLKDVSVNIDFTWTFDSTLNANEEHVIDTSDLAFKPPAKALSMVTNETFDVIYHIGSSLPTPDSSWEQYIIPMDSYIDIELTKGVYPDINVTNPNHANVNHFGGVTSPASYIELIPPQRGKSDQVKHKYEIKNIRVLSYNGSTWKPYDPFAAYVDLNDPLFQQLTQTELDELKYGFWQKDTPNKYTKLRVLAQHTLSFLSQGTGNIIPEELGITANTIFCEEEELAAVCIDFDFSDALQNIIEVPSTYPIYYRGLMLKMDSVNGLNLLKPDFSLQNAVAIAAADTLEIILPESSASVCLSLSGNDGNLIIEYYKKNILDTTTSSGLPIFLWSLITTTTVTPSTLSDTICYNDAENPTERILIINGACEESSLTCGELTAEADLLKNFFNTLVTNNQLITTFKLYPDNSEIYDYVYEETALYDHAYEYTDINYIVQYLSTTKLVIQIQDNLGFTCDMTLELSEYDVAFDIALITEFTTIEADPDYATNGPNYHFLITAVYGKNEYILKGVSCYPISYCEDSCYISLHKICYLSLANFEYNQTIPSQSQVTGDNEAMLNAILKITPPVWRPYTDFMIVVETLDTISNINSPPGPYTNHHGFGFRTAGPIGHFHEHRVEYTDLVLKDKADQFRLSSLKPYIDYTTSYPNADGNILNAKPLFYGGPKLLLYYKYAHVYTMLRHWNSYNGNNGVDIELHAIIKDPADALSSPPFLQAGLSSNKGPQSIDIQTLNNLVTNGDPCSEVEGPVQPNGIHSEIEPGYLLPEKLYTAVYYVRKKSSISPPTSFVSNEVHRYPFQTSRYENFTEQIQSYVLSSETGNERYAGFNVDLPLSSGQLSDVQNVIAGTESASNALLLKYADPFDRIMNGILKLPQLDPAQTTEFNVIRNSSDNNSIIGILVRSTEPLNDPKLPLTELLSTLTLSMNSGSTSGYQIVFSKDRSKIYVTKATSVIATGSAVFTFQYKLYDGTNYQVVSTETATLTID